VAVDEVEDVVDGATVLVVARRGGAVPDDEPDPEDPQAATVTASSVRTATAGQRTARLTHPP
jgi:hypothetical protein